MPVLESRATPPRAVEAIRFARPPAAPRPESSDSPFGPPDEFLVPAGWVIWLTLAMFAATLLAVIA
jgi:hypothetical protein